MQWRWPGWLLCALTAGLFAWIFFVEIPPITALIDGMKLPDQVLFGYDDQGARALFGSFLADQMAAEALGRPSAAQAYLTLHAGYDLVLPPLLAASLAFCAFAALGKPAKSSRRLSLASTGFGLVLASSFTYLVSDVFENHIADAMFGPEALKLAFNQDLVFVLQALTRSKFASLALAFAFTGALWFWRWKHRRRDTRPEMET